MRVLLVTRSAAALAQLEQALASAAGVERESRLMSNGSDDPLREVRVVPDAIVLRFDATHLGELAALAAIEPASRPPVVLVGPMGDVEAMRLAVRCGARDFLPEPLVPGDLVAALERIRDERRHSARGGGVFVVLGAGGGVGTSLLAANFAHRLALDGEATVLVDLDLVRAPLASLFDVEPRLGLADALTAADALDAHAVAGYCARHPSGLLVIGGSPRPLDLDDPVPAGQLPVLLDRLGAVARHVVVDAGSTLGPLTVAALRRAACVLLVTQQSVLNVRGAVRIHRALIDGIGVPPAAIRVLVNRRTRGAAVAAEAVDRALGCGRSSALPNDFRLARESMDTGVPLADLDRGAALTRAIAALVDEVARHSKPTARAGLLERALPLFGRRPS